MASHQSSRSVQQKGAARRFKTITLFSRVSPDDTSWECRARLENEPTEIEKDESGEKGWVKTVYVTNKAITLTVEKQGINRILENEDRRKVIVVSFAHLKFPDLPPKATTEYVARMLKAGIVLNGQRYIFYGHGNSQLKSRICYLYAASSGDVITKKINSFGDFSRVNTIAKRAKRIGLLFSSAEMSMRLDPARTKDIDDVEVDGHIFTDGCGMLSKKFAEELAKKRKIVFNNLRYVPSAFQIRYKGYKGMLMMNPQLEDKAHFRSKSMKKFEGCSNNTFAVLDYSKPFTYANLNGQLVTLLSALGIPDEVFIRKQKDYFEFLQSASTNPLIAFQFLCYKSRHEKAEQVLIQGLTEDLQKTIRSLAKDELNLSFKGDKDKKAKVRIRIPDSRVLFGVCDYIPGGVLKEGECHVRITQESGGFRTIVGARVVVSRSPCLHPGDIRKFRAVEVPEFNHLVDCIVFPVVGERDPASLMSGGDLDGDKFHIFWDKDLIPEVLHEPYGYPAAKEALRRDIKYEDMIDYFAGFNNASLGRVDGLYLKWVRVRPDGAASKECQELNKLFSSCVDGERIKIPEHLETPPNPPEGAKPFIVDVLCDNVNKMALRDEDALEGTSSLELLENILSSPQRSALLDEFQLYQLTLRWCRINYEDIRDYLCFFDFGAFTMLQKHAVLCSLWEEDPSIRYQYIGAVYNGLYQSDILYEEELHRQRLGTPNVRWQKLYSSFHDSGSSRLYSSLTRAMEQFERKLIVFTVDEQLKVVLYIPKRIEKETDGEIGELKDSIKMFAFNPFTGHTYKRTTTKGYRMLFEGETIQIYDNNKPNTFIWFALNQKWSERMGIRPQQRGRSRNDLNNNDENKTEFKVSIALQKFSQDLSASHHRVNKQASQGIELYVISNRDREGHNLLDISMSDVPTNEIKRNFQNIPKDYSLKLENADWLNREFCQGIIAEGKLEDLALLKGLPDALDQVLTCCVELREEERLVQIVDRLVSDLEGFGRIFRISKLMQLLDLYPSLCRVVIPKLSDVEQLVPGGGEHDFGLKFLGMRIVKALLLDSANGLGENSLILFLKAVDWMESRNITWTLSDIMRLIKLILFSVWDFQIGKEIISQVFHEESKVFTFSSAHPGDHQGSLALEKSGYAHKFLKALAVQYLFTCHEACPCDLWGVPLGAVEFSLNSNSAEETTKSYKNHLAQSVQLSEFLSPLFPSDGSPPSTNSDLRRSEAAKLVPCQTCVEVNPSPTRPGYYETLLRTDQNIPIKNEDHIRLCASKKSTDKPKRRLTVFDAVVKELRGGKMTFRMIQTEPLELTQASWNIYVCASTTNLSVQMGGIQKLLELEEGATKVFGSVLELPAVREEGQVKREIPANMVLRQGFNHSQRNAIEEALTNPLTLIWGPPGTGKTTVIVEIILQLLRLRPGLRLLVTASSHNAVDNVMERFLDDRKDSDCSEEEAIRYTSESSRVVSAKVKRCTLDAFVGKSLHNSDKAKGEALKKLKLAKIIFSTCAGAGVGMLRASKEVPILGYDDDNEDMNEEVEEKKRKKKEKAEQKFDVVIVDEASQITEPEALTPLVKSSKIVILVGDHVQLSPSVSEIVKEPLGRSLFEKLYLSERTQASKVILDTQYRMHPALAHFPSSEFYGGKLRSGVCKSARVLQTSKFPWPALGDSETSPLVFAPCPGLESSGSVSKSNQAQAKMTVHIVKLLRDVGENDKPHSIVILTPYTRQVTTISQLLRSSNIPPEVKVNTIDGFQGKESDIIIFSTVRANHHRSLGFLTDRKRINVALTRARFGLIIIGHLETLKSDPDTERMIAACKLVEIPPPVSKKAN